MTDHHHDSVELSLEGVLGRILGQDILLRRMLIQMAVTQASINGSGGLPGQRQMLEEWLHESLQLVDQIRIDHPDGDDMKAAARSSLETNLGDVIQAIEAAVKSAN